MHRGAAAQPYTRRQGQRCLGWCFGHPLPLSHRLGSHGWRSHSCDGTRGREEKSDPSAVGVDATHGLSLEGGSTFLSTTDDHPITTNRLRVILLGYTWMTKCIGKHFKGEKSQVSCRGRGCFSCLGTPAMCRHPRNAARVALATRLSRSITSEG